MATTKSIQTLEGQSVLDVAVQAAGSIEAAIEMATVNDLSITDDLAPVEIRTVDVQNKIVAGYYDRNNLRLATAVIKREQIFEDIFDDKFA